MDDAPMASVIGNMAKHRFLNLESAPPLGDMS